MDIDIDWSALERVRETYKQQHSAYHYNLAHYCEWMRNEWGIDHDSESVCVVDTKKYAVFLLKFA